MIHFVSGKLQGKNKAFAVVENNGIGLKIYISQATFQLLPKVDSAVKFHCHLHVREDKLDLFGFLNEEERTMFVMLIGVSGIGPKSALGILSVASIEQLKAAITSEKIELLSKASGVGKKTAQRIVLELKNKVGTTADGATVAAVEADMEVEEALVALGYPKHQARVVVKKLSKETEGLQARLREALQILNAQKNKRH